MAKPPNPIRLSDEQRFDWLRLIRSENVGPRAFRALLNNCGGAGAALRALPELARRGGAARAIRVASAKDIEQELAVARKLGVRFVAWAEPEYPPILRQIDSAPPILAFSGQEAALRRPAVAIVGSRNASAAGLTFADRLARGLGRAGYVVVSGLARGIDQRAHAATLETGAVGVLAGGHAKPYPADAAPLIARMGEFGAVVSEMPIEWEARGRDFPRRNRIVSGLALGTVVVEAARGSGSLITAKFALEQNRQVFAVPGSPLDPRAEGANDLLRQGATICTTVDDVVAALEPTRPGELFASLEEGKDDRAALWGEQSLLGVDPRATPGIPPGEALDDGAAADPSTVDGDGPRERIVALLGPTPIALDQLSRAAEASTRDVRVALMELELAGRIEFSGDRVALRPPVGQPPNY
jgi:DNA processing protein